MNRRRHAGLKSLPLSIDFGNSKKRRSAMYACEQWKQCGSTSRAIWRIFQNEAAPRGSRVRIAIRALPGQTHGRAAQAPKEELVSCGQKGGRSLRIHRGSGTERNEPLTNANRVGIVCTPELAGRLFKTHGSA